MRAVEAEARRYHMLLTGAPKEVDWTLDPLIKAIAAEVNWDCGISGKKRGVDSIVHCL
jgi:hypothetical protein